MSPIPITSGYTSLANLKARLALPASDTVDDLILENIITAVSREIDGWCRRRFYAATETRYFSPEFTDVLYVDDLQSVTTLKTDADGDGTFETTWATTDYRLEPYNATVASPPQPYTAIRVTPSGRYIFPAPAGNRVFVTGGGGWFYTGSTNNAYVGSTWRGVEIAGSWGYSSTTPPAVEEACLIQSSRLFRRKDAPFGVAGAGEFGQSMFIARMDPDVKSLLLPYMVGAGKTTVG